MKTRLDAALVASAILVAIGADAVRGAETPAEISAAWRRRETALKFGRIEWTETTLHKRGSFGAEFGARAFPEEDTSVKSLSALSWAEGRMAYRSAGMTPAIDRTQFVAASFVAVCGGKTGSRTLSTNASIALPTGTILAGDSLDQVAVRENVVLIPVLLWMRPLDRRGSGIDLTNSTVMPRIERINGRECIVLGKPRGTAFDEWWIDPKNDHRIMRWDVKVKDRVTVRFDLNYEEGAKGACPRLSGWRTSSFSNKGDLNWESTGNVTNIDLVEKPDPEEFEMEFLPGTQVHDRIRGLDYTVK